MSLQTAIKSVSPKALLTATFTFPSFKHTDIRALAQDSTHTNSTQLAHRSDGLRSRGTSQVFSQREGHNDGLTPWIEDLDLNKEVNNSAESFTQSQQNNVNNTSDEEECPSGIDTLDCEECGGPERPWGDNSHIFHCRGIEAEGYRWKDCYCMDFTDECGPCTFDADLVDTPNDRSAQEEELRDSANETENLEETSIEQRLNDATNAPDDEECPTSHDTLDCEDCGGPEQTWETSPNKFHCKGIEEENHRWKDCYCLNWENARGPCTFDCDLDETSHDPLALEEELQNSTNETENLEETSIKQQLNDAANVPNDDECPTSHDTLDCEDCGGPEQTWETGRNDYHCKGIESECYKWKDCYCINWEHDRGPCRLGHDWDDDYFPFENLPDLPSPSFNSSDYEDLADDPSDSNNESTDGQDALESGPEGSATATEEEEPQTERD
ncbi:hypothetical protein KCU78_g4247, partial [Aureobasidium melanogenum]